ncbi:MAG: AraC family transcriptional regulator [Mizugakiibacter sp.]|uniref:AraC family transcriptional regulator n=1 Tax=Mizugakiibacter sp. TaxID=1972610 RepID=UPI0031C1F584|nr:AraC family transcriptional regulator [Xanthomonadaceae bacterium]
MPFDLLSAALELVRLTGALMFRVDLREPFGIASDPAQDRFAALLPTGTSQVVAFHIVLDGACWMRHAPTEWFRAAAGDAVVMPLGGAHDVADRPQRPRASLAAALQGRSVPDLRRVVFGDGPNVSASLLCGFLGCDRRAFEPLFNALPACFRVRLDDCFDTLVRFAVGETQDDGPGTASLRLRLAELLFMQALRRWMQELPGDATGWLAGLRDPQVGRALRALHEAPCKRWTVEELADAAASSRSSLAVRFRELIGEPPMHYLTHLRMQLAARQLCQRACSVASLADEVGYDSAAAFQRAFKRCFGVPPAAWRRSAVARAAAIDPRVSS